MFDRNTQDLHEKRGASQWALHLQGSQDVFFQSDIFISLVHQLPGGGAQLQFRALHVPLSVLWEPAEPTRWHCDPGLPLLLSVGTGCDL